MRCIHVQRNFGFAYSKEMIHQNCRWLWRRRKHRFSLCAWCPPVVFMFSYSGVNQTHQWQILVLCKRYRRVCLVFFVSAVRSGKLEYSFPCSQLDLDVQTLSSLT